MKLTPKVFVDFDGTITKHDVGNAFFRKFGDEAKLLAAIDRWKAGELSGSGLLLVEASTAVVTEAEAVKFIEGFEIDVSFKDFLGFCRSSGIELSILSDGLAFYIERILSVNGIEGVPFYSNRSQFIDGGIKIEFPYESDCTKCANCKGYQVLTHTGADEVIVYIGNGYFDRCAVQYADSIFAKDDLLRYCEENGVTYFPYDSFQDVLAKFRKILERGKLRKRHRAELKRREAYISE